MNKPDDSFATFIRSKAGLATCASLIGILAFFALLFAVLHDGKIDKEDFPTGSSDHIPRTPVIIFVDGVPIIF